VESQQPSFAKQWLCKHIVSAATNTRETIEELLEAVFSVRSVPRAYKGAVGLSGIQSEVRQWTVEWSLPSAVKQRQ
jgi:hypothetical protein